jgi:hypothetical protein
MGQPSRSIRFCRAFAHPGIFTYPDRSNHRVDLPGRSSLGLIVMVLIVVFKMCVFHKNTFGTYVYSSSSYYIVYIYKHCW